MKYSEIKEIYSFASDLGINEREVIEEILAESDDFEIGNYRFIRTDVIDEIQVEELESDPYVLGCFNPWFLADILNISSTTIEKMQSAEAFKVLGELIIGLNLTAKLQREYVRADGYGYHFAHYDNEQIDDLEHFGYLVFRVN